MPAGPAGWCGSRRGAAEMPGVFGGFEPKISVWMRLAATPQALSPAVRSLMKAGGPQRLKSASQRGGVPLRKNQVIVGRIVRLLPVLAESLVNSTAIRSAADMLDVGWPEPAEVLHRIESTRSCWASLRVSCMAFMALS